MTTLLLIISHMATAGTFAYVGYRLAPRVVCSVEHHLENTETDEEPAMADDDGTTHTPLTARLAERRPLSQPTVIIIASVMVMVIGLLSFLYIYDNDQRADRDRERQACMTSWAKALIVAIEERQGISAKLRTRERQYDDARAERDHALNGIIDLIIRSRAGERPPPPLPADPEQAFGVVLEKYAKASAELEVTRAKLNRVRDELDADVRDNPYPTLDIQQCRQDREERGG